MSTKKKKNNSLGWLEDLTRTFKSGIRIRHKVPTAIAGKTASDVVGHLSSKNYFYMHPNQIYGTYDRMIRYSDFAEMEFTPECASALNIYAEECTSRDENGRVLKIVSNNSKIKEILESFYQDVISIDHNIFAWVRNLCKYGDFFLFVDIHPNYGVTNVFPIPVDQIEREEGYDNGDPFAVRFNWITNGNQHLSNHQVIHFRLLGNDSFLPYGSSLLEPSRRIWRQLCVSSGELVLTDKGYRPIDLIAKGDIVYAWDPKTSALKKTKVVAQKNMGKQDVYEVRTAHRSVKVTDKHGLMVFDGKEHYYKQAQEIETGVDKIPIPVKIDGDDNVSISMMGTKMPTSNPMHLLMYGSSEGSSLNSIPDWCFNLTLEARRSLIRGICSALVSEVEYSEDSCEISIVKFDSELLSEQFSLLCSLSGIRAKKTTDKNILKIDLDRDNFTNETTYETVLSYELADKAVDTFDLQVEDDLHNFIVSGVVSHNTLLEDAVMVYRLVRSPERRVFKIDVGNIPPEHVDAYVEKVKSKMKRQIVTNETTGRVDLRYSAMTVEDDYYIPVRGDRGSDIQTLAGGQYTGDIQDIEYMQGKLFAALQIPRSYLGYNEGESAGTMLSQIDIRFNKLVQRIQRVIESELKKLAMIHLYAFGFRGEDLVDFDLKLAASSMLSVQQNQEIWRNRLELMSNIPDFIPNRWAMKTIMGFDDDELEEIFKDKIKEAEEQLQLDAIAGGSGGGNGGGLGGLGGGGGGGGFGLGDLGGIGGGDNVDDIFSDDFSDDGGNGPSGGEVKGGTGPVGSEVEDLFAGEEDMFKNQIGPFGTDGSVLQKDDDRKAQFARRRKQAALKHAIIYGKMGNRQEDEELEPVQRTGDSGRQNAPGQGRKRDPGNGPEISSGDGTGKRHISTQTGHRNRVVKRSKDELIADRFKRKLRNNPIQNRELAALRNSLQSAFRDNLYEEVESDKKSDTDEKEFYDEKEVREDPDIINDIEQNSSSTDGDN